MKHSPPRYVPDSFASLQTNYKLLQSGFEILQQQLTEFAAQLSRLEAQLTNMTTKQCELTNSHTNLAERAALQISPEDARHLKELLEQVLQLQRESLLATRASQVEFCTMKTDLAAGLLSLRNSGR